MLVYLRDLCPSFLPSYCQTSTKGRLGDSSNHPFCTPFFALLLPFPSAAQIQSTDVSIWYFWMSLFPLLPLFMLMLYRVIPATFKVTSKEVQNKHFICFSSFHFICFSSFFFFLCKSYNFWVRKYQHLQTVLRSVEVQKKYLQLWFACLDSLKWAVNKGWCLTEETCAGGLCTQANGDS